MVIAFLIGAASGVACFAIGLIIGEKFAGVKLTRDKQKEE